MFRYFFVKELKEVLRDARFQVMGGLVFILLITATVVGYQGFRQLQQMRKQAQKQVRKEWVTQKDKHPHSAAHYGHIAFKPKPTLSFMDFGLDAYTGMAVYLEAHKQNDVLYSQAQDSSSLIRFGEMTIAFVLQMLLPLLIIFLVFASITKEREGGTLKMMVSQGISTRQILLYKIGSYSLIILLLFLPAFLIASTLLFRQSGASLQTHLLGKFLTLFGAYWLYFTIFIMLAVLVSAFSKTSRTALVQLLGVWIFFCILMPKATANVADNLYASPAKYEFDNIIKKKVTQGIDGHNPSDQRFEALKKKTLKKYGVDSLSQLPINFSGLAMQTGEEYTDKVYDREFKKVQGVFKAQNRVSEIAGLINPLLAIRHISMGLAGTDYHHHVQFATEAENYRRKMVKMANKDMMVNHKPGIAYRDYNVGRSFWEKLPPFQYQMASLSQVLGQNLWGVGALLFWLVGCCLFIVYRSSFLPIV
ncbi:DUF3526 domain-containing protein [uncultured Microscilla sp.]|uniref:ABC transporter permease n=1 Tax=uncultured Microscilla sp. TaxID=432653 RepID=UPI00260B0C7C|nr:DUF3526 domain-containing protein [uncultured Microscilla sp.]